MLTLLTFPAGFGDFSLSPFCSKAAYLLQMSGQTWQRRDLNDPRKTPMGKLPVLQLANGELIADTWNIRSYLEELGADFDAGLNDDDRATAHLLARMVEEHLYFLLLADRWANDAVWPTLRDAFFAPIPRPIRVPITALIRRNIVKALEGQGVGRMSTTEQFTRADADLTLIADRLSRRPFLMADHPTAADASVAPVIGGLRDGPVETALTRRVRQDAVLSAYVDRMRETVPV